ncbi:MAG: ribbon-helix-helix domain-containing protein [Betaproteobacteria bacterium]|nr:ribbon-helix-helix domain-containing protein [Betaproteobacteria bacterium]
MKIKTSVTLSDTLLVDIDRHAGKDANRSEFIETAVRSYIAALVRKQQNLRDLAIINRRATRLNREAKDVLGYQIPL